MTHTSRFEVTNKQIKDMSLGDEVTVTLKGKITQLEAEREMETFPGEDSKKGKKKIWPPEISIEVSKTSVKGVDNDFSKLADD